MAKIFLLCNIVVLVVAVFAFGGVWAGKKKGDIIIIGGGGGGGHDGGHKYSKSLPVVLEY